MVARPYFRWPLTAMQRQTVLSHTPPGTEIAVYSRGRILATRVEGYAYSAFMTLTAVAGSSVWDEVCVVYRNAAGELEAIKPTITLVEAAASWHLVDGTGAVRAGGGLRCTRESLEEMAADWPRFSSRPLPSPRIVPGIPVGALDRAPHLDEEWSGPAPVSGPCPAGLLAGRWIALPEASEANGGR